MRKLIQLIVSIAITLPLQAASIEKELAKKFFAQSEVDDVRITPGNKGLSYISHERTDATLKLLDFEKRHTYKIKAAGNSSIYDYYWIDRDSALVYSQKLGTPYTSFVTNYTLSHNTPTLFTLVYDTLPDTKRVYLAKEGRVTDKFPDLYKINAITQSKLTYMKNPGNVLAWYTDKDGVARIQYTIDKNEKDIYEYRKDENDRWNKIDINGHPLGVLFTEDKSVFILFIRRDGNDKFAAYKFDADNNAYLDTLISHSEYDIIWDSLVIDPETEESHGIRYNLEKPKTHWLNQAFQERQKTIDKLHPDTVNDLLGFGLTEDQVIYKRHSDRLPGEWRLLDSETGNSETLLTQSLQINPTEMQTIESISYQARDGVRIHGYLTKPKNGDGKPTKTLLMIHGGPRARDYWGWDAEAQYFAALGYAVLKINYRGSDGYGLEFSPYYHFSSMESSVRDTIDAASWMIAEGIADPNKLSIYGSSFGGHVALSCAAEAPELFASAIGYAGVYNWLEEIDHEFKDEPIYARLKMRTYYGDYENERDKWLAASAISKVAKIDCPIFLIHGRSDDVVSSTQSRRMRTALRKAGKEVQLKLLNFNRHGLAQEINRIDFYTQLALFLKESNN